MLYSLNYQCLEVAKATLSWYTNLALILWIDQVAFPRERLPLAIVLSDTVPTTVKR